MKKTITFNIPKGYVIDKENSTDTNIVLKLAESSRPKSNVLNNKNVDCFIAGYNMAAKEYQEIINKGYKEIFTGLPDKLNKQLEDDEASLGYSGYMFSYPDWFVRKKSAYIALRDALGQCEEFINDIKTVV